MKTNATEKTEEKAQGQSEQSSKLWNVILDGEVIGTVHGATQQHAQDAIAPFRMKNLTVAPRD